jgi:hypothetical protein
MGRVAGGGGVIKCFSFSSRGEATNEALSDDEAEATDLAPWEGSVIQRGGMTMSAGGEAPLGRGNGGDDARWTDTNLTGPKNEENSHGRFSFYRWTVKI